MLHIPQPSRLSHEEWARLCFAHVLAERRGRPPLLVDLDDLLPFERIPEALTEMAIRQTVDAGRTVQFVAYGVRRPTTLTIPLRASRGPYDYRRIADPDYWVNTSDYEGTWSFLAPFIDALPFESIGRVIVMFSRGRGRGVLHFDHDKPTLLHEFIWLKPTHRKRFLLRYGSRDHAVTSRSCWFDSRHMHQTDGSDELEVSMRVDGLFTPDLRRRVVERTAAILDVEAVPEVSAPDFGYSHRSPSDWERLFRPRHYTHYFQAWTKQLLRTGRVPRILAPETTIPKRPQP
jgi:hypothetical protein